MKKCLFLVLCAMTFVACEDLETNDPIVQADLGTNFFKSGAAYGTMDSGDFATTIKGMTNEQELELHTGWRGQQAYPITKDSETYAIFTDKNGNKYRTDVEGASGEIVITGRSDSRQEVTGTFEFTAIFPGVDTISVQKGHFYAVPYIIE